MLKSTHDVKVSKNLSFPEFIKVRLNIVIPFVKSGGWQYGGHWIGNQFDLPQCRELMKFHWPFMLAVMILLFVINFHELKIALILIYMSWTKAYDLIVSLSHRREFVCLKVKEMSWLTGLTKLQVLSMEGCPVTALSMESIAGTICAVNFLYNAWFAENIKLEARFLMNVHFSVI